MVLVNGSSSTDYIGEGFTVELDNVSYLPSKYSTKPVLKNIKLNIKSGEFVAIIGSNAAGKSSLLKVIAGELDTNGMSGEIKVAGQIINRPINQYTNRVGIVHQFDDSDLIEHLSIAQNIAIRQILGGGHKSRIFATSKAWQRETVAELGSKASLAQADLNVVVRNLAGGKRQMLSVAIAIHLEHSLNPCRLLLLDEHTSRLDPKNAKEVMEYTAKEIKRIKTTALMVTHKYSDAKDFADRILVIVDGAIFKDVQNSSAVTIEKLSLWVEGIGN